MPSPSTSVNAVALSTARIGNAGQWSWSGVTAVGRLHEHYPSVEIASNECYKVSANVDVVCVTTETGVLGAESKFSKNRLQAGRVAPPSEERE